MDGIIVYGSLLSKSALSTIFGSDHTAFPVKVFGWKRSFNQRTTTRKADGNAECVLNVRREKHAWFNGVLVTDFSETAIERFQDREVGYQLTPVSTDSIVPYDTRIDADLGLEDGADVRLASGSRFTEYPRPIPAYTRECLDGAAEWGDRFLTDFVVETYRL